MMIVGEEVVEIDINASFLIISHGIPASQSMTVPLYVGSTNN